MPPIIGLTGGSGTGKSTLAKVFAQQGVALLDADALYHQLCQTNTSMLAELAQAFGGQILGAEGTLQRPILAQMVFADASKLQTLQAITTPYIAQAIKGQLKAGTDAPFWLLDAPTLFETGLDRICAQTIGVLAPYAVRRARIMARDKLTGAQAEARLQAQPPDAFYRARCTYLLENHSTADAFAKQALHVLNKIQKTIEGGNLCNRNNYFTNEKPPMKG